MNIHIEATRRWCYRKSTQGWSVRLIASHLSRPKSAAYRILKKGVDRPLEEPRRKLRYIRWERETPNDLWQCDKYVKELDKWLCAYMDDRSRFVVSAKLYDNATAESTIDRLLDGVRRYGTPRQILTDHGVQFYAMRHGESSFDRKLKELGVEHIMPRIGRPTTTGKIERFFATYSLEAGRYNTLEYFIHYYNFIRPHQSLSYRTPAERYGQSVPQVTT